MHAWETSPHAYGPGTLLGAWARPAPKPNKPLARRRVKKVSEPALVSHRETWQPPTRSQAPTPHRIMPIGPDGRRRESTHKECIWVIQLKSEGHSYCKIQQQTGVAKTDIHCIFNDWNKENMIINKPCSGWPKKLLGLNKWHLPVLVRCNQHATLHKITADSELNCSTQ
jgi:hypothetical protein